LLSATADKGVQTTSNKTTDNNFHTHYILHFIFAQDKFLRLDTTFFLHPVPSLPQGIRRKASLSGLRTTGGIHKPEYKLLIEM